MTSHYPVVPPHVDLPQLEHQILALWRANGTFEQTLKHTADGPRWTFYEGPPTANGTPGAHHVEARAFKDVVLRFKTMQGFRVDRKAGWDCQGLHVEVGVEKELGISGKRAIEAYGIARFNAQCLESVQRSTGEFEEVTERMGYWLDTSAAYRTMDSSYIQSVWWSLKQIYESGLLYEAQRISPYCPRCETALSDHELGQTGGYETVVDPSVYVRFPLTSGPLAGRAAMLVWTTTPWTLVSNTAVAVHPDVEYVVASNGSEKLIVAEPLLESALGDGWAVEATMRGAEMERWSYQPPLDLVTFPVKTDGQSFADAHYVVLADYVTTEDGSGLVHQSPAFGADDMAVAKTYGLPIVNPVQRNGHFAADVRLVGGQFFKHADTDLVRELDARGLLFRHVRYEHSYPHCWRCHTPLMYYALPAWYIRTTAVKDALLRENQATNWYPDTIKWGRYGDWLNHNVDWSLSRTRYWGTPLPIWRCPDNHLTCVGSLRELGALAGQDLSELDPHRPYVDDVVIRCGHLSGGERPTRCGAESRRVPEVIDAWYDSGSMPFAQWGFPHLDGSKLAFERAYPAQFICEAIDQTRGWFYTLMAIGTLVFDRSAYQNVVCLGLLLAEDGRKMSKHLGNILEPMPLMEEHGADAVRWFMLAGGSPWAARRVGHALIQETVRKVLLTYWNTVAFHALYARVNGWTPGCDVAPAAARPALDRWLISRRHALVRDVTAAFEVFDTQRAGQLLADFIDDMSNWYVRRSRRRFWDGEQAGLATLHETLDVLTRLMAPMTPFITERVWQDLVCAVDSAAPASVHLAGWPSYDQAQIDVWLDSGMSLVRRLVELGRSARAEAKIKTRQPLSRVLVSSTALAQLTDELKAEIASELNIERVESFASAGDLVDHTAKGNFRTLGKRFGPRTPDIAAAIATADPARLAAELVSTGTTTVDCAGPVELTADEVITSERPRAGWSVVNEHGETIALDLKLTPELVRAGVAREVIRLMQEERKASGLEVSDRINLTWSSRGRTADALREHAELVAREVLAVSLTEADQTDADWSYDADLDLSFKLEKA
ncbi:MAG: isoleucine--tRNA ligase [Nocardioidaceae bacterium]